ncbi:hypothetical protein [Thalassomonas actiniarum]|nr:hypothetical protein [Thalassomonas actiniarum]
MLVFLRVSSACVTASAAATIALLPVKVIYAGQYDNIVSINHQ